MEQTGGPSIVAILGTSRPGNYTGKALALAVDEARKTTRVTLLNSASLDLGFPGVGKPSPGVQQLQAAVREATGVILATPEYHGGMAAMMKLVIENLGFPSLLAGKPVALLGTAAGAIGAIKSLEQLRSICSHVGALVLPGVVSVAGVQRVFTADGACTDPKVEARIRGLSTSLIDYFDTHVCPAFVLEQMVRDNT